ncbi:hypothetical protein B0A52_08734 [Exophiala mesophila]|uniref:Uncharacterized protein n=1 Tax=Exophiala mesophila TaxID=212818 RepID=A0A438MZ35_EXOME|nr:hypothetical protein B0A52_08734 [Exophiala mesophila]
MKSFIAATLFAASVLAVSPSGADYQTGEWGFTYTLPDGKTSVAGAGGPATETTASFPAALTQSASGGDKVWTSYTSYTATYSSGNSTWGVPTTLSYSIGEGWTSQIPAAPKTTSAGSVTPASTESAKSTLAPTTTVKPSTQAASSTSPTASAFTGAANTHGKMAGVGAMAMAGLALVL